MDALEITWRIGVVIDSPADALAILDSARESALKMAGGKELNTTLGRIVAAIDEFRGWRLITLQRLPDAVSAFQSSFDMAQTISRRDSTDANANSVMLLDRSGMCPTLALMGRREEALSCARHTMAQADELAANGPDRVSMAPYIPRSRMWVGAVYEALAVRGDPFQRRLDWAAAAQSYQQASEAWQKLHGRADIIRFQPEIAESARKAADCNRRAGSRV